MMRYVFSVQSSQYPPEPYTSISQGSHEDNSRNESSTNPSKAKGKEVDPRERVGRLAKGETQSDAVCVCVPFSNYSPEPYISISQHAHEDTDRANPSASLSTVISVGIWIWFLCILLDCFLILMNRERRDNCRGHYEVSATMWLIGHMQLLRL